MKAAGIKSQVGGPAAEAKPVDSPPPACGEQGVSRLSITFAFSFCKLCKLQGVTLFRRPLPKIASFFSIDFKPQNFSKMCQNGIPVARQIELKIDKSRKKRVKKTHLKPTPQKTSKISDFGRLRDLPNRAETLARTPLSQIHPITKKCSTLT